jgi:hypothetical protein
MKDEIYDEKLRLIEILESLLKTLMECRKKMLKTVTTSG